MLSLYHEIQGIIVLHTKYWLTPSSTSYPILRGCGPNGGLGGLNAAPPTSPILRAGADHTVALTRAGTVLTWGSGQQGMLGRIGERVSARALMDTLLQAHVVVIKRKLGISNKCIHCPSLCRPHSNEGVRDGPGFTGCCL